MGRALFSSSTCWPPRESSHHTSYGAALAPCPRGRWIPWQSWDVQTCPVSLGHAAGLCREPRGSCRGVLCKPCTAPSLAAPCQRAAPTESRVRGGRMGSRAGAHLGCFILCTFQCLCSLMDFSIFILFFCCCRSCSSAQASLLFLLLLSASPSPSGPRYSSTGSSGEQRQTPQSDSLDGVSS